MLNIEANTVIIDLKGSCSSQEFFDSLVKFAAENISSYLDRCLDTPSTLNACDLLAKELGFPSSYDWLSGFSRRPDMIEAVASEFLRLSKEAPNSRGIKELQSIVWLEAYQQGLLQSQVFDDIAQSLSSWKAASIAILSFSSETSIYQREFFAKTTFGDLSHYFAGFFDSSTGSKTSPESYERIARLLNESPENVLLIGNIENELSAARNAGLQTIRLNRSDDTGAFSSENNQCLSCLYDLRLVRKSSGVSLET